MTALGIIWAVFARTWRKVVRRPVVLLLSFVQPMIWMLLFGFLFQRFSVGAMDGGMTYLDFLLPGVCAMTVLFGASQSGIGFIRDIQTAFLGRILATPAGHQWLLIGTLAADVSRLLAQAAVVCLVGVMLGARVQPSFWPMVLAVVCLGLFGAAYASVSSSIALRTHSQESMAAFVHVVNLPMFFTSTALVPAKVMPAWLEQIAVWNPFSLVVNTLREALLFGTASPAVSTVGPLLVLAVLLFLVAVGAMKKAV
ncbi:MAG: ABC transporter permease [SAR324 cluster bacterium]|nr:ABC transporter permease [SAR324 cluster bacterium]